MRTRRERKQWRGIPALSRWDALALFPVLLVIGAAIAGAAHLQTEQDAQQAAPKTHLAQVQDVQSSRQTMVQDILQRDTAARDAASAALEASAGQTDGTSAQDALRSAISASDSADAALQAQLRLSAKMSHPSVAAVFSAAVPASDAAQALAAPQQALAQAVASWKAEQAQKAAQAAAAAAAAAQASAAQAATAQQQPQGGSDSSSVSSDSSSSSGQTGGGITTVAVTDSVTIVGGNPQSCVDAAAQSDGACAVYYSEVGVTDYAAHNWTDAGAAIASLSMGDAVSVGGRVYHVIGFRGAYAGEDGNTALAGTSVVLQTCDSYGGQPMRLVVLG